MSNNQNKVEIPSYREQIASEIKKLEIPDTNRFAPNRMPLFAPFQVIAHRELHTTSPRKDGKGMFDSVSHLITIKPKANPNVEVNFVIFDEDWENIKALTTLYPPRPYIMVTLDTSTKPKTLRYTYHSTPT